jgi:DNA-binding transcriptional regulator PaaX
MNRGGKVNGNGVGGIEARVAQRGKREKIQNIVLTGIYAMSALGLFVTAGNTVQLLKYVEKYIGPKKRLNQRISQAMLRLTSKGLISKNRKLTSRGEKLAQNLERMERVLPQKLLRWDKKWRMVIFDVWEKRRDVRDRLRAALENNGFVKIQNSVWVYPYPCEEFFAFLRTELRLGSGMLYIVAEEIENDRKFRRHFGLPLD